MRAKYKDQSKQDNNWVNMLGKIISEFSFKQWIEIHSSIEMQIKLWKRQKTSWKLKEIRISSVRCVKYIGHSYIPMWIEGLIKH